jgi:hypothetical protein
VQMLQEVTNSKNHGLFKNKFKKAHYGHKFLQWKKETWVERGRMVALDCYNA